tara:strand:+ start:435 stop:938 length:504 start_codon:yes stop_codon:yes gene_type:complete
LEEKLAGTFCPEWVFNLCVARTAYEFIISDLPIKSYAKKYEKGLGEHYQGVTHEEIEASAELILRFLVEINAEKSDELLNNYVFFTLKYDHPGSKRKLKGLLGTAFDKEKSKSYSTNNAVKSFRAYVFGLRSGVTVKSDPGWEILEEKDIDILINIIKEEADIVDGV